MEGDMKGNMKGNMKLNTGGLWKPNWWLIWINLIIVNLPK